MPENTPERPPGHPPVRLLASQLLARHGARAAFSLRTGGVSPPPFDSLNLGEDIGDDPAHVAENLRRFASAAGLDAPPHRARQTHGVRALVCTGTGCAHADEADILIGLDGAAVAVRTADCVPVLLADVEAGVVAAVHAGWRGTAAGAAGRAVSLMRDHGALPERMVASIGPAIGPCCFEIGADTARALARDDGETRRHVRHQGGRHFADLQALNALQLRQAGLDEGRIERIVACTCCDARRFFSWRRDGAGAGRHLAVVALAGRA